MTRLYAPGDSPTYEQEPDARFERDQAKPCIHQGEPAAPRHTLAPDDGPLVKSWPDWRPARVPQVEYHPGPPYRSMPKLDAAQTVRWLQVSDERADIGRRDF